MQKKKDFPYSQAILKKGIRAKWPHNRNLIGLFFLFIPITQSRLNYCGLHFEVMGQCETDGMKRLV